MTTVVYLEDHRTAQRKPVTVQNFLQDLSAKTGELAEDWLFQSVSAPTKRQMLADRGLLVRDPAVSL